MRKIHYRSAHINQPIVCQDILTRKLGNRQVTTNLAIFTCIKCAEKLLTIGEIDYDKYKSLTSKGLDK